MAQEQKSLLLKGLCRLLSSIDGLFDSCVKRVFTREFFQNLQSVMYFLSSWRYFLLDNNFECMQKN